MGVSVGVAPLRCSSRCLETITQEEEPQRWCNYKTAPGDSQVMENWGWIQVSAWGELESSYGLTQTWCLCVFFFCFFLRISWIKVYCKYSLLYSLLSVKTATFWLCVHSGFCFLSVLFLLCSFLFFFFYRLHKNERLSTSCSICGTCGCPGKLRVWECVTGPLNSLSPLSKKGPKKKRLKKSPCFPKTSSSDSCNFSFKQHSLCVFRLCITVSLTVCAHMDGW